MKLPPDVREWLNEDWHAGYAEHIRKSRDQTIATFERLGIPTDGELAEFYLEFGPGTHRGWYELLAARELEEWTAYARENLSVPEGFVALTSIEGQGFALFDTRTGAVYDVEYGQFGKFAKGELEPLAASFTEFLRWCKKRDEDR